MKRYCLLRVYGDESICWTDVPRGTLSIKIGDESHQHSCTNHIEGGVVIALIDSESKAASLLGLIEQLDLNIKSQGGEDFVFSQMLGELLTLGVTGSEATVPQRTAVKQHFAKYVT